MRSLLTMGLELLQLPPCCLVACVFLDIVVMSSAFTRVELSTSSNTLHNLINSS